MGSTIMKYVGYFSALFGALVIVWGIAKWTVDTSQKGAKTDKLEIKMGDVQKAIEEQKHSQDSLKTVVIDYANKSDALQKSYVQWVQEHSANINDLAHSLQGITFELVTPVKNTEKSSEKSAKPSAIIRVVPMKK